MIEIKLTREQADKLLSAILEASGQAFYEAKKDMEMSEMLLEIGLVPDQAIARAEKATKTHTDYNELASIVAKELTK